MPHSRKLCLIAACCLVFATTATAQVVAKSSGLTVPCRGVDDTVAINTVLATLPAGGEVILDNCVINGPLKFLSAATRLKIRNTLTLKKPLLLTGGIHIDGEVGTPTYLEMGAYVAIDSALPTCSLSLGVTALSSPAANQIVVDTIGPLTVGSTVTTWQGVSTVPMTISAISGTTITFSTNLGTFNKNSLLNNTISTVNGSTTATIGVPFGMAVGVAISGSGLASNNTVITAVSGTTLTLDRASTSTSTNGFLFCQTPGAINLINTQNSLKHLDIASTGTISALYLNGGNNNTAQTRIEDVTFYNGSTGVLLTIDGAFETYLDGLSFTPGTGSVASILLTSQTNPYFNVNLLWMRNSLIYNNGIVAKRTNLSSIHIADTVEETPVAGFFQIDATYGSTAGLHLKGISMADGDGSNFLVQDITPGVSRGITGVTIDSPEQSGAHLASSSVEATINGVVQIDGHPQRYSINAAGTLDSEWSGSRALIPALSYGASIAVPQTFASWTPGASGSIVAATAPDGSNTAGLYHCTAANCTLSIWAGTNTLATGDWLIAGMWGRSESLLYSFANNAYNFQIGVNGATTSANQPQIGGNIQWGPAGVMTSRTGREWQSVTDAIKITSVAASPVSMTIQAQITNTHDVSYWMPWLVRIPAGTMTDEEVIQYLRYVQTIQSGMPAGGGIASLLAHQKLYIGNDVNLYRPAANTLQTDNILKVGTGGSANKGICWKSDGKTLGYCSTAIDGTGTCTCN